MLDRWRLLHDSVLAVHEARLDATVPGEGYRDVCEGLRVMFKKFSSSPFLTRETDVERAFVDIFGYPMTLLARLLLDRDVIYRAGAARSQRLPQAKLNLKTGEYDHYNIVCYSDLELLPEEISIEIKPRLDDLCDTLFFGTAANFAMVRQYCLRYHFDGIKVPLKWPTSNSRIGPYQQPLIQAITQMVMGNKNHSMCSSVKDTYLLFRRKEDPQTVYMTRSSPFAGPSPLVDHLNVALLVGDPRISAHFSALLVEDKPFRIYQPESLIPGSQKCGPHRVKITSTMVQWLT
ncbi:hypothetical protein VNI00_014486 [Paramarasmius palmivorus]|uniref:Uncharacterized protein n=1 Tax=Paramarasmius palmivorus TaxID=297713 RepID=A0AAW0BSS4_9AGAR